jgi:hypothetical protein
MTQYTLTLLDTTGIQEYIFTSNRLQENIGASELVYRATSLWAFEALQDAVGKSHNVKPLQNLQLEFTDAAIESDPSLRAEVIQAAGGNTVILFRGKEKSRKFVRTLTRRLLEEAPGLTVLAQHDDEFDFSSAKLSEARKTLEENMRAYKLSRLPSAPTLGLGVTAMCDSTGLAAVNTLAGGLSVEGKLEPIGLDGEDMTTLVSSETAAKRVWRGQANERLKSWLKPAADKYIFPFDLEKIGRIKGDESYVAVIHADGNKMGDKVKAVAQGVEQKFSGQHVEIINREYIRAMREFSQKVNEASLAALNAVVGLAVQAVENKAIPFETDKRGVPYLPLRPLVFGGDDVTFVCNGNIGVQLAATYLEIFHKEAETRGLKLHACAGVSIVKMHYPFARAYKLSEELAGSAKSLTRETDCSALDWHFAQSGLSGSLESIREREYKVKSGTLCLRPLTLDKWDQVNSVMDKFNGEYWGEKHNKVLGLREPLRDGPQTVEKYRQDFDLKELPEFAGLNVHLNGWLDGICYYFDAIELLDHHIALKNKEAAQ